MDMTKYRDLFLSETREHLNNMNRLVVALEESPEDRETIDALFREAHSIKGMAASMGFDNTAELSHHLEDYLDGFRETGDVPEAAVDRLLAGIDLLEGLLDDLQADQPERSVSAFLESSPSQEPMVAVDCSVDEEVPLIAIEEAETDVENPNVKPDENDTKDDEDPEVPEPDVFQVNVDLSADTTAPAARAMLVLRELGKTGEVLSAQPSEAELKKGAPCQRLQVWFRTSLNKNHIDGALTSMADIDKVTFVDDRRKETRAEAVRTVRIRTDLLDQFVNLTGELITQRYMLDTAAGGRDWDEMESSLGRTARLIDDLHHHVLKARLMPLENVTGRLPRIVRDLSRKTGKQVTLKVTGGDVGLDRVILEELTDPLVHLVRNAIDHGIVDQGLVTISARREKDLVLIEVGDDGGGIDPQWLRDKAVEKQLLTEAQAEALGDRDALMLVCMPGFSTAEAITETSGRGVGMDVVKAAVENLGGTLDIHSVLGEGTRFQLRLPLSIAIIKILLISCGGYPMAIPITRVHRSLDVPTDAVRKSDHRKVIKVGEEAVSLISLAEVLGLESPPDDETTWVVITEVQGRRVGLQVDRFLGQREAFVKSLGFPLNRLTGLSGATVEGNGSVIFIIDPQTLLEGHEDIQNLTIIEEQVDALP